MAATVMGYPSGAPEQACVEISPLGHTAVDNMATGPVPYSVNISSLSTGYVGGQTYTSKYSYSFSCESKLIASYSFICI